MAADTCPCCASSGVLPDEPWFDSPVGRTQGVRGETVLAMCEDCIFAAFLSDGNEPHPHPMEPAQ